MWTSIFLRYAGPRRFAASADLANTARFVVTPVSAEVVDVPEAAREERPLGAGQAVGRPPRGGRVARHRLRAELSAPMAGRRPCRACAGLPGGKKPTRRDEQRARVELAADRTTCVNAAAARCRSPAYAHLRVHRVAQRAPAIDRAVQPRAAPRSSRRDRTRPRPSPASR